MRKFRDLVRTPWQMAAVALLAALTATIVYRAATQSISHDEGLVFEWFETGPWSQLFGSEFGNHHPLTVLLSRISITFFGLSELSLRLPSVVGSALYLIAVYRICTFLLREGALFLLGVSFLTLNPFVLDYLCLARGYSLGLALLMWAIYPLMLYLSSKRDDGNPDRLLNKAGVALGLSIGSNVIMIFPAIPLLAAFFALLITEWLLAKPAPEPLATELETHRKTKKDRKRKSRDGAVGMGGRSAWQAMIHLAPPAFLVAGIIVIQPQKLVYFEEGYLGPPSLLAILQGIVAPSLLHSAQGWRGLAALVSPDLLIAAVSYVLVPALILALLGFTLATISRCARGRSFDTLPDADRFLLLLGITIPAVLALIVVSRYVFDKPYPEMRTVLYWIPLLGLACLTLIHKSLEGPRPARMAGIGASALLVLFVFQFATQFNTRYYAEWAFSAATRDMMERVRTQHASTPEKVVRVGTSWELEPSLNFYRMMWQLKWMEPVVRESPDAPYDYYFLLRDDRALIERRKLKLLLKDDLSQTSLAQ